MTAVLEFATTTKSDRKSLYIFSELYSEDKILAVNNLYTVYTDMAEVLHVTFVFCCQTQLRESANASDSDLIEIFWEI